MVGHDQWFTYNSTDNLLDKFPQPLICHYAYWTPEEGCIKIGTDIIQGFITDLDTAKTTFCLMRDGQILESDSSGVPLNNALSIDFLEGRKIMGFTRFDKKTNILVYRNHLHEIEKVLFSKYLSLDKTPLLFIRQGDRMVWADNREYAIPQAMGRTHLIALPNYLYLESLTSKRKGLVLVPFQEITIQRIPAPEGSMNKETPLISGLDDGKFTGLQRYFAYEVSGNLIHPTSSEGNLFLAYIYLAQKQYEESIALIHMLNNEPISTIGMKILEMIQSQPLGENHPDAKMVGVHALALSIRQKDNVAKESNIEYFQKKDIHELFFESSIFQIKLLIEHLKRIKDILQSSNNISIACRLKRDEEADLLAKLQNEAKVKIEEILERDPEFDLESYLQPMANRIRHLKKQPVSLTQIVVGARRKDAEKLNQMPLCSAVPLTSLWIPKNINSPDYSYYLSTLPSHVAWLNRTNLQMNTSVIHYQYSRSPVNLSLKNNGAVFKEIYHIAQKGSDSQKLVSSLPL